MLGFQERFQTLRTQLSAPPALFEAAKGFLIGRVDYVPRRLALHKRPIEIERIGPYAPPWIQTRKAEETPPPSQQQQQTDPPYFLPRIASLAALATRNFTTRLAGILISSPVAGLRPIRALRLTSTSLPSPGSVKLFLAFL